MAQLRTKPYQGKYCRTEQVLWETAGVFFPIQIDRKAEKQTEKTTNFPQAEVKGNSAREDWKVLGS